MRIKLKINETGKIELTKLDEHDQVQGECCITVLELEYPETIKGYQISNYTKYIEFAECREVGPCAKFFDEITGNTYELKEPATSFPKLKIQFTFKNYTDKPGDEIVWKSNILELEFNEAINAEGSVEIQSQLLSLKQIEENWESHIKETEENWENYIKANCFKTVYKISDIPTANAETRGDTIFYLGPNITDPYTLTYGHYYRCNLVNGSYEWTDLTIDPSVEGVANGVREINTNQTVQFWLGSEEDLEGETIQENVVYIPRNQDIKATFDEVLTEMAEDENCDLAVLRYNENKVLKDDAVIVSYEKLILEPNLEVFDSEPVELINFYDHEFDYGGKVIRVYYNVDGQERFITITPSATQAVQGYDVVNYFQRTGVSEGGGKSLTTFTYHVNLNCTAEGVLSINAYRTQIGISGGTISDLLTYPYQITVTRIVQVIK